MFDKDELFQILDTYSDMIREHEILKDYFLDDRYVFEIRIFFRDSSILENREVFLFLDEIVKRKYKYHWMDRNKKLIIRWDNAPHHPNIENFPHHLHRGSEENIETSSEMNLVKVLRFIKSIFSKD